MGQSLSVLLLLVLASAASAQDRFMAPLPPDAQLQLTKDVEYVKSGDRALKFDLYRPASPSEPLPIVIMLNGVGADWMRQHVQYTGWVRAAAGRGSRG
jgi:poly(3-hydroxybutyrate) depolymerase